MVDPKRFVQTQGHRAGNRSSDRLNENTEKAKWAVGCVGVGWCAQGITTYGNVGVLTFIIVVYIGFPWKGFECLLGGKREAVAQNSKCPSVRGKGDCLSAQLKGPRDGRSSERSEELPDGKADGSGAGFSQEGQTGRENVE